MKLPSSPISTTCVVVFLRFLEEVTGVVCDVSSSLSIVITCGGVCCSEVCRDIGLDIGLDVGLDVVLDVVLGLGLDVVDVEVAAAGEVAAGEVAAGEVAAAAEVEASLFFVLTNFDRLEKIP